MITKPEKLIVFIMMFAVSLVASLANAELIAHWKLDEKAGDMATDSSGNENTGTLHGELAWAPTEGKFGGAVRFGKTDSGYIEVPFTKLSASQGTISLWSNISPDQGEAHSKFLFGHSKFPHWSNRLQLYVPSGVPYGDPRLNLGFGDSHTRFTSIKYFRPGTWYHVALTWDQGNYVVYINGLPEVSGTYTGFDGLGSIADIGNDGRNDGAGRNESFSGLIDEVLLFNHPLDEYEIMQLYLGAGDYFVTEMFLTLLDNIKQAKRIDKKNSPHKVASFLEEKIAEYSKWEKRNPDEIGLQHKRLFCEQCFLLAKAKEAANAPVRDIIKAYQQSVSQLQFRQNYVPALLWLYKNVSAHDFINTVKKSVPNGYCVTDNLYRVAMDFELSNNWEAFELYLDAIFSEINDSTPFAEAMAKGLRKESLWADNFSRYVRNKPQLNKYYFEAFEKRASEKIAQNDFMKAADIYRDIINRCTNGQNKAAYELKMYGCIYESGEYRKILSELDRFISDDKTINKDSIVKALLLKGQVLIQLDEIGRACETFLALMKEYPETQCTPEAGFFVGYCYMLQGKYDQAIEAMSMVIKNYPENPYADKAHLCLARINDMTK